ncbi:helix-turn-helix domain-containing protein [Sporocytophaga sp.]|uniref:winged helix-turn-helix transcriptional regulator n=1 Tax=Sporocytophaga sp. TaxID=2231183 RepID=UPI0025DB8FCF|nr:helix-turn-helix domain-containing protein [Sporocytophaga sp.]
MKKNLDEDCGIRKAMKLVGSKWKVMLIRKMRDGAKRYGELKRLIPDVSEKMLIQELKELMDAGLVAKIAYAEVPPRVEYKLTEKGEKALPILDSIVAFGEENF